MLLLGDADSPTGPLASIGGSKAARSALSRILGGCTEVSDLETAIKLHQENGGAFVVPEGPAGLPIVVTPRGEIRIGPAKTNATMVLQRRRALLGSQRRRRRQVPPEAL